MAAFEFWIDTDLTGLPTIVQAPNLFYDDAQANKIGVNLYRNGEPVNLGYDVADGADHDKAAEIMAKYFQLGNVDLLNRPTVSAATMQSAGWVDVTEGYATVYTCAYSAGSRGVSWGQNLIMHITPIRQNGTVLTPSQLDSYVDSLLTKTTVDDVLSDDNGRNGLILYMQHGFTNWTTAETLADQFDDVLHRLQAVYYLDEDDMPTESGVTQVTSQTVSVQACVVRANGTTLKFQGSKTSNKVYITLPATAYDIIGRVGIYLKLLNGESVTTVGGCETRVYK